MGTISSIIFSSFSKIKKLEERFLGSTFTPQYKIDMSDEERKEKIKKILSDLWEEIKKNIRYI